MRGRRSARPGSGPAPSASQPPAHRQPAPRAAHHSAIFRSNFWEAARSAPSLARIAAGRVRKSSVRIRARPIPPIRRGRPPDGGCSAGELKAVSRARGPAADNPARRKVRSPARAAAQETLDGQPGNWLLEPAGFHSRRQRPDARTRRNWPARRADPSRRSAAQSKTPLRTAPAT